MRKILIAGAMCLSLGLAACDGGASLPPLDKPATTTEVIVPIAKSCVPSNVGHRPTYTDTKENLKAASGADGRYQLLAGNWPVRDARLNQLEDVIDKCR